MEAKKILLVTSGQPSANPRLVKEATTLAKEGHKVTVIYCPLSPWADDFDNALFQQHSNIHWVKVGYHPKTQKFGYFYARLRQKLYHILFKLLGNRFDAAIKSLVLFNQELTQAVLANQADYYIGHNLGALPAVVKAANKNKGKAFFDFEDFHRGEDKEDSVHWKKTKLVEDSYIPFLQHATTASPLITEIYQQLYPKQQFSTILNCFTKNYQLPALVGLPDSPLKLFWFSQTIGKNRGLEQIIEAMGLLKNSPITLTLLGNINDPIKNYFQNLAITVGLKLHQLIFLQPVSEKDIVAIAANHHIGLATEIPHNLNRELCLTNKIFMYLLAGNCILFSNTKAQKRFYQENPQMGELFEQNNAEHIAKILNIFFDKQVLLSKYREASFECGKNTYTWEFESLKYYTLLKEDYLQVVT